MAARLTHESVALVLYGWLPTDLDRRIPFNDCEDDILWSPRRTRCRPFPLLVGVSSDKGGWSP